MTRLFEYPRPYIICEVGSNWLTLEHCLESIAAAKACGASAVKFQAFSHEALYGWEWPTRDQGGNRPNMTHELELTWIPKLKAKADAVGIGLMCTAFSPDLVAAVDPFVEVHKVASSDAAWPQMLDAVKATGKPVLVSLGAKTEEDVRLIRVAFHDYGPGWVPMTCVASYPADFGLGRHATDIDSHWGFSDHTLGYTATVLVAVCGVAVIEKHFTAFPDLATPDRGHSLTPRQFKRMVDMIRGREVASEELEMGLRHNRRLIATRDVTEGEILIYGENFGAYRSLKDDTRGLSPMNWRKVHGRRAFRPISRGDSIGADEVDDEGC